MAEVEPLNLPPEEAIEYFRDKKHHIGWDWRDTAAEQHVASFTVAKMMETDLLQDVQKAVGAAIEDGTTFEQFRAEMEPLLRRRGWWGQKDGVQLGSVRRLRTIFDVNIRTAYAEGQWKRIERVAESRPYLRYVATLDNRTRPQHRAWHEIILPIDHPFWETHFPPNGWRCRCGVVQLSDDDLKRNDWKVSSSPRVQTIPWENRRTGKIHQVPVGIDPGWDHNVGKISGRVRTRELLEERVRAWPEMAADAALEMRERDFGSRAFRDFIRNARPGHKTYWPVGALPIDRARNLGLPEDHSRIVDLTPDTVSEKRHRDRFVKFTAGDWARIQTMLNDGEWSAQSDTHWRVKLDDSDGKPWSLAIKRTAGGELMVATYHRLQSRQRRK